MQLVFWWILPGDKTILTRRPKAPYSLANTERFHHAKNQTRCFSRFRRTYRPSSNCSCRQKAVIDLQPGQTEVALPASGVIDATDPQFRSGITGVGSSQNRINTTLTGSSLLIKTSEFDPDNSKR